MRMEYSHRDSDLLGGHCRAMHIGMMMGMNGIVAFADLHPVGKKISDVTLIFTTRRVIFRASVESENAATAIEEQRLHYRIAGFESQYIMLKIRGRESASDIGYHLLQSAGFQTRIYMQYPVNILISYARCHKMNRDAGGRIIWSEDYPLRAL